MEIKKSDICAIRASGFIPVIPLTIVNKDTPMCIEDKRSIADDLAGFIKAIYTSQIRYINVLYYTKYELGSCKAIAGYTWRQGDRDHIIDMIKSVVNKQPCNSSKIMYSQMMGLPPHPPFPSLRFLFTFWIYWSTFGQLVCLIFVCCFSVKSCGTNRATLFLLIYS